MDEVVVLRESALEVLQAPPASIGPETFEDFCHRSHIAMARLRLLRDDFDKLETEPDTPSVRDERSKIHAMMQECLQVLEKVVAAARDKGVEGRYLYPEKDDVPVVPGATREELEEALFLEELGAAATLSEAGYVGGDPGGDWTDAKHWTVSLVARHLEACDRVVAAMPADISGKFSTAGLEKEDVVHALDAGILKWCTDGAAQASFDPDVWRALRFLRIAYPSGVPKDDRGLERLKLAREIAGPVLAAKVRLELMGPEEGRRTLSQVMSHATRFGMMEPVDARVGGIRPFAFVTKEELMAEALTSTSSRTARPTKLRSKLGALLAATISVAGVISALRGNCRKNTSAKP